MSGTRKAQKEQFISEAAVIIDNHIQARKKAEDAIHKAQKKRLAVKPKKPVLISILTISMLIVGGSLSWAQSERIAGNQNYQVLQQLKQENQRLVADKVATDALHSRIETVYIRPVSLELTCQSLYSNLGNGIYCL